MRKTLTALIAATFVVGLSACSEKTEDNARIMADRAAEDAKANAEVVENAAREGAIVAADKVSDAAVRMQGELRTDEANDVNQGDGKLDGTD